MGRICETADIAEVRVQEVNELSAVRRSNEDYCFANEGHGHGLDQEFAAHYEPSAALPASHEQPLRDVSNSHILSFEACKHYAVCRSLTKWPNMFRTVTVLSTVLVVRRAMSWQKSLL